MHNTHGAPCAHLFLSRFPLLSTPSPRPIPPSRRHPSTPTSSATTPRTNLRLRRRFSAPPQPSARRCAAAPLPPRAAVPPRRRTSERSRGGGQPDNGSNAACCELPPTPPCCCDCRRGGVLQCPAGGAGKTEAVARRGGAPSARHAPAAALSCWRRGGPELALDGQAYGPPSLTATPFAPPVAS